MVVFHLAEEVQLIASPFRPPEGNPTGYFTWWLHEKHRLPGQKQGSSADKSLHEERCACGNAQHTSKHVD